MSRRSDVVRSSDQAQAVAVERSPNFTWNASISTIYGETDFQPGNSGVISASQPFHTSLGIDKDFDASGFPDVRIRIPRDGIYSVSARVWAESVNDSEFVQTNSNFILTVTSTRGVVDKDMRTLAENDDESGAARARLHVSHAGFPFEAGDLIWATGRNDTTSDISAAVDSLSVTYEAEIGTVYHKVIS